MMHVHTEIAVAEGYTDQIEICTFKTSKIYLPGEPFP